MIAIIVAIDKNRGIGNKGTMPWKIKGELERFKSLTTGNVVVMGRRTFEAIGKPLKNRMNVIVSSTLDINEENCISVRSLQEALEKYKNQDIYISGGSQLYQEALAYAERLYITEIDMEAEVDTYFPEFNKEQYHKQIEKEVQGEINYRYCTYFKK